MKENMIYIDYNHYSKITQSVLLPIEIMETNCEDGWSQRGQKKLKICI